MSKRYELEKELRKKDYSLLKQTPLSKGPTISLRSQVAVQARKHLKVVQNSEAIMRQSKLLLFKNMENTRKRKNLGYLLEHNQSQVREPILRQRHKQRVKKGNKQDNNKTIFQENSLPCGFRSNERLGQVDFLKLFILEQLLHFLSQTTQRGKDQLLGFCRLYLENCDRLNAAIVPAVFQRQEQVQRALILERLGLYVILLLSTDSLVGLEAENQLRNLCLYLHTTNLIVLDLLINFAQIEGTTSVSQFHIFNTLRFNEQRRKIAYDGDAIDLLQRNCTLCQDLLRTVVKQSAFQSLRQFTEELLESQAEFPEKYQEAMFVLMSLEQIMASSAAKDEPPRPSPPFLPPTNQEYTLVLDLDETLIHCKEVQGAPSFLVRPYVHEFLGELSKLYEIVIFTAAVQQYADTILDKIDPEKHITHRLYRQHTRLQDFVSIKDLSMIGRNLKKTIIVDNIAANFRLQPRNGIYITTWIGQPNDCCLRNLHPVLQILVRKQVKDVRSALEDISKYMQSKMQKNEPVDLEQVVWRQPTQQSQK